MLMSVDGKISTGAVDELDIDREFPRINGVKEGVYQYYEIEKTTDLWSLNCKPPIKYPLSLYL